MIVVLVVMMILSKEVPLRNIKILLISGSLIEIPQR